MKFSTRSADNLWKFLVLRFLLAGFALTLAFLGLCPSIFAQSPVPAATGAAKDNPGGFTPGWTLGAKFEGSYSDGEGSVKDMAEAAAERGYEFIGITDHSKGLKIAGGINETELEKQGGEIEVVNDWLSREGHNLRLL